MISPGERIHLFANHIVKRAASELKDPDELITACAMIVAGSFRDGITSIEVDGALGRFNEAVKVGLQAMKEGPPN